MEEERDEKASCIEQLGTLSKSLEFPFPSFFLSSSLGNRDARTKIGSCFQLGRGGVQKENGDGEIGKGPGGLKLHKYLKNICVLFDERVKRDDKTTISNLIASADEAIF